ncbi:PREDICTED: potassium voltage-gated channel subfamily E member 1-like protein [Elephantulus edwardii]|uniref:potassium voltage-gated channel subfamily E member 1-like protein n=1 Tax=Elephantulus edwardii TaxID=28737 RepID=UPI0003F0CFD9|nr:PREDICTED: potassium voltage-gated channel subfamily E member 1-like protein [Elephantulus edwardii]
MNCSESQWLRALLSRLLLELYHRGNASDLGAGPGQSLSMGVVPDPFVRREASNAKGEDAYLYILLIMIFYACLAGGLILAYTRSRKLVEAKKEPAPACSEHERGSGAATDAETAALAQGRCQFSPSGLSALVQGTEGV